MTLTENDHPEHHGLPDPLHVPRAKGDQPTEGGIVRGCQAEQLGEAEVLRGAEDAEGGLDANVEGEREGQVADQLHQEEEEDQEPALRGGGLRDGEKLQQLFEDKALEKKCGDISLLLLLQKYRSHRS